VTTGRTHISIFRHTLFSRAGLWTTECESIEPVSDSRCFSASPELKDDFLRDMPDRDLSLRRGVGEWDHKRAFSCTREYKDSTMAKISHLLPSGDLCDRKRNEAHYGR